MDKQVIREAYLEAGSIKGAAKLLGIPRSTYRHYVRKGWLEGLDNLEKEPLVHGELEATAPEVFELPTGKSIKRYIISSAQNNTKLNQAFWNNLTKLAAYYDAQILIGTYTYNLAAYGANNIKYGSDIHTSEGIWFDEQIVPYIQDVDNKNIHLAPDLIWCGRANILPTAERPLSGFETYTGESSGIYPHAKLAMDSIPNGKFEKPKFNYTTGTVTQRNYIKKKAGLKAEHHHCYGALVVEVNSEGDWWVRQINADSEGTIHDLDIKIEDETLTRENRILAINWGDIHVAKRDHLAYHMCWGRHGIMDTLKPHYQFMHDLSDFEARNHHNRDHYSLFSRYVKGLDNVEKEMQEVGRFLEWAHRKYCNTVVVYSNHDAALSKWLAESDYRNDPVNAVFFLKMQTARYLAIEAGQPFHVLEHALTNYSNAPRTVKYLWADQSLVLSNIEFGNHGHLGPNGAKGSPRGLSKTGKKANTGHTHSAGIIDGLYTAGVTGKLNQGYNVGPSSWSQTHILTYPNGKRALITHSGPNLKWRA